jgi:small subunit ribosomal protein S8
MTMTDPIADFITRIRNGQQAKLMSVSSPYSAMRKSIADVLLSEGYIRNVSIRLDDKGFNQLVVELKYADGEPVIKLLTRVSKPGRRVYSKIADLKQVYNGLGINILSTNRGVLSDCEARKQGVGGEVLCQVF